MSIAHPETITEWKQYAAAQTESEIWELTAAVNSTKFFKVLLGEGYTASEIKEIWAAFARRCLDLDVAPPLGAIDMTTLIGSDMVQKLTLPDHEECREGYDPSEPDDVDREIEELDLETEWEATSDMMV
jgi:hypothetical protein